MMIKSKTFGISIVMVLVVALVAVAAVKDTKHNFSSATSNPNAFFYGTTGVCIFCHTAHNSGSEAPLWNHEINTGQDYLMYDSPTMDMPQSVRPHNGSLICLSCHDGTIAVNSLNNLPGSSTAPGSYGSAGGSGLDGAGKLLPSADGYVGTDLRDDHPVGITYDQGMDNDFVPKTGVSTNYPDKLLSEGLYVECVSCHDPHDNTYGSFLVESNANSQLCSRCHTK